MAVAPLMTTHGRDRHDENRLGFLRRKEARRRLPENAAAGDDKHERVGERGQHGGFGEAVGALLAPAPLRQPCRAASKREAEYVG
jgi:hypothetical protein